jgi:hypothetical protein
MMTDNSAESPALETQGSAYERSSPLTLLEMKDRQRVKLRQLRNGLVEARLLTVEQQAEALALAPSTAWNLLKGNHKGSGLSPKTLNRILAASRLPPLVRATILEYIAEKVAGLYGDRKGRLTEFTAQLSVSALEARSAFCRQVPKAIDDTRH